MEIIVPDPRVVPEDRRTLGETPIEPCRSHALLAGTVKLPSATLRLLHTRAVSLHAFRPLIAKNDIFYQNSSVRLLIRLTGLPAEILYARGISHSYLCCSCHVFLAIKLREDAILCIALGTIYLLNATVYCPRRWSRSGAIVSEVIIIPARDLSKGEGSISCAFPSRKLDWMVRNESLISRGCVYMFEHEPRVQTYEAPCTIHYRFDSSERRYTTDISVTWSDRKPVAHLGDPENSLRWTAVRLWGARHNAEIVLMTDTILRMYGAILSNLELLAVCSYQRFPPPARKYLLKTDLSMNGQFTPNDPCEEPP